MKIKLKQLQLVAKNRPEGYLEHVLSLGTIQGDVLQITSEHYKALVLKYNPSALVPEAKGSCCGKGSTESTPAAKETKTEAVKESTTATKKPLEMPSIRSQLTAGTFAALRVVKAAVTGQPIKADDATVAARKAICGRCDKMDTKSNRCSLCGCRLALKQQMKTERCPIYLW